MNNGMPKIGAGRACTLALRNRRRDGRDDLDPMAHGGWRWRALFLCLLLGWVGQGTARAEPPVRIAIAGPMSGASFSVGMQYKVGVTAALDTLTDGRVLGRELLVTTHDDNCRDTVAEKVAETIVHADPPAVVIGHSCSAATIAAAPIYAEAGVLQITPASTNPKVTEMGIGTIFRMIGRDDGQADIAARRIAGRHQSERLGVVHFGQKYARELARATIDRLKVYAIEPLLFLEGQPSAQSYIELIQALIDARVQLVYLVGGALDAGVFVRQARLLDAPFKVIGSDTLVSKVFIEAAGQAGESVPFTFPPEAAALETSAPAIKAIRSMAVDPAGYTLLAYAATEIWLAGVNRAGSFVATDVAEALRSAPVSTILGPVGFDAKGDILTTYPPFSWYVWKAGKRVLAE